jgi:hypothetical protein
MQQKFSNEIQFTNLQHVSSFHLPTHLLTYLVATKCHNAFSMDGALVSGCAPVGHKILLSFRFSHTINYNPFSKIYINFLFDTFIIY